MFDSKSFSQTFLMNLAFIVCMTIKIRLFNGQKRKILKAPFQLFPQKLKQQKQKPWCRQFIILIRRLPLLKQKHYCLSITLLNFINLVITYYCEMINPILYFTDERTSSSYYFLSWNEKNSGRIFRTLSSCGAVRANLVVNAKVFLFVNVKIRFITSFLPLFAISNRALFCTRVPGYVTDEEYNQQVEFSTTIFTRKRSASIGITSSAKWSRRAEIWILKVRHVIEIKFKPVRAVIEKQFVSNERLDDMDIMSIAYQHGLACVQVMFIRQGKYWNPQLFSESTR